MTGRTSKAWAESNRTQARRYTITDGRDTIGRLIELPGNVEAVTAAGKSLGTFPTRADAIAALDRGRAR